MVSTGSPRLTCDKRHARLLSFHQTALGCVQDVNSGAPGDLLQGKNVGFVATAKDLAIASSGTSGMLRMHDSTVYCLGADSIADMTEDDLYKALQTASGHAGVHQAEIGVSGVLLTSLSGCIFGREQARDRESVTLR
jgi:hypothetical protein